MSHPHHDKDAHSGLHSEHGRNRGEHRGRSANPTIKVADLAWLEFEKPDLARAEKFARAFGFKVAYRDNGVLYLRGSLPGTQCMVIRQGPRSRFVGPTFKAADSADLRILATATGSVIDSLDQPGAGRVVRLQDPSGFAVSVVHGADELDALAEEAPLPLNFGTSPTRINMTQRRPAEPSTIQRLGHVVLQTPHFMKALDWYLDKLGMIVSDFQYVPGQRERGPALAFIRCDRGSVPADHHTLAVHLGPVASYSHSAYQVTDLDTLAAGGVYLADHGYDHAWGIGRHELGSQIFDYWRDPDKFMVEHFADGDLFDNTVDPGWAPMTASGLAQWGPRATREYLGISVNPKVIREVIRALRADNEVDLSRLIGMAKGMNK